MTANIKYLRMNWGPDGRKVFNGQLRDGTDNEQVIMGEAPLPVLLNYAQQQVIVIENSQEILNKIVLEFGVGA